MSKNDNFKQKIRSKIFRRKKFIEMIIRTNNIRRTVTDLLLQKGLANPVLFPLKKTHKSNHRNNTKIRLNTSQLIVSLFLVAYQMCEKKILLFTKSWGWNCAGYFLLNGRIFVRKIYPQCQIRVLNFIRLKFFVE